MKVEFFFFDFYNDFNCFYFKVDNGESSKKVVKKKKKEQSNSTTSIKYEPEPEPVIKIEPDSNLQQINL